MKKTNIPDVYPDLQAYARGQTLRFWCKWGATAAAVLAVELLFLTYVELTVLVGVTIVMVWIAFVSLFFYVYDGFRWLCDPSFEGIVEIVTCSDGRGIAIMPYRKLNRHPGEMGSERVGRHPWDVHRRCGRRMRSLPEVEKVMTEGTACTMTVRTDEGGTVEYMTVFFFAEDIPIHVGDRIVKYRGLPYPIVLSRKNDLCAVCGGINEGDVDGTCSVCGHTLIK